MLKPVTDVIPRQPLSPKPVWQRAELFVEPQLPEYNQGDEAEAEAASIITA
ncbi:hypothetical protein [Streptomyces sp. 8L]|uniref:hypothetical protein n=1 Tax=Streptomyces sp. 8L TaxID=2877242 RepID=UPI001CD24623|nr:hypothetical protein [Streptomyces sp. 8L]MCA1223968.1 hypothetical protein [Streptomyces sp. 8L]